MPGCANRRERFAWLTAGALFLLALALMIPLLRRTPTEAHALRFSISTPEKAKFSYFEESNTFSLSPDGRSLAFTAHIDGRTLRYGRHLDALAAKPLAGTDGASSPFRSPDSRFIAYLAEGKLKRVEADGGRSVSLF